MHKLGLSCAAMLLAMSGVSGSVSAQDFNYVPGWANTKNHEYKGKNKGEWKAKTELFNRLGARNPDARCTLKNLSEADGNVIVNQYRSRERKTNAATAFRAAQQQVDAHHRRLKARGKC